MILGEIMKKMIFLLMLSPLLVGMAWGQTYLINEGFESTTFPPTGWTNSTYGATRKTDNSRTGIACLGLSGKYGAIYTPQLANPDQLSFWYKRDNSANSWKLVVQVSTDASNWTNIYTIINATTTYQQLTLDLSSYSDIYIKLLDQRDSENHLRYVDDFTVTADTSSPSITVNPSNLFDFTYVLGNGPSAEQSFALSGKNLSTNLSVLVTSDYAISSSSGGAFGSSLSFTPTMGGSVSETIYVRQVAGLAIGSSYTGTVTCSSTSANNKAVSLSGIVTSPPPPLAPVTTVDPDVENNSFTASWNSVSGAVGYYLDVYTKSADTYTTDLFISEYIEGTSYMKALEIFNGTGVTVDLSAYSLMKQKDGKGAFDNQLILEGTLAHNDVYVIALTALSSGDFVTGDMVDLAISHQIVFFDGNDAVALYHNGTQIDVVGFVNQTTDWGRDITLVRKAAIASPTVAYNINDWDQYPVNTLDYLGAHAISGGPSNVLIDAYNNFNVGNVTSHNVIGLTQGTTYYYVVRAYDAYGQTSISSNEIATTTTDTLPVELSSFTVSLDGYNNAVLTWVTQTETEVSGFYIYRNTEYNLEAAELISNLIPATNTSQQKIYVYTDKELSSPGVYYYWLESLDLNGESNFYGPIHINIIFATAPASEVPLVQGINSAYPNPFNPIINISCGMKKRGQTTVQIFNVRGQLVKTLFTGTKDREKFLLQWDGTVNFERKQPSGVYLIRHDSDSGISMRKVVLSE